MNGAGGRADRSSSPGRGYCLRMRRPAAALPTDARRRRAFAKRGAGRPLKLESPLRRSILMQYQSRVGSEAQRLFPLGSAVEAKLRGAEAFATRARIHPADRELGADRLDRSEEHTS